MNNFKRFYAAAAVGAVLCSCNTPPDTAVTATTTVEATADTAITTTETTAVTVTAEAARPLFGKITDKAAESYTFGGCMTIYDWKNNTRTFYKGEITDPETISELWEFIKAMESNPPFATDDNDSFTESNGTVLIVTDMQTEQSFNIRGGFITQNPYDEGGPDVMAVTGGDNLDMVFYPSYFVGNGEDMKKNINSSALEAIMKDCIVREENQCVTE